MSDQQLKVEQDLTHSMAHYLLTIHKLIEQRGYARVTDIAKEMHLTKGSVSTSLNVLKKRNLIEEKEDSKFLDLTEEGHQEVHRILSSKTLLYFFLKDVLKVSEKVSHRDSCLMEHLMSDETREMLFLFLKNLSLDGKLQEFDLHQFQDYNHFEKEQKS